MNENQEKAITYFNRLLQNFSQFDVAVGINISKNVTNKNFGNDYAVVIYNDIEMNTLHVATREEYQYRLSIESEVRNLDYSRNMPVIYEITDNYLIDTIALVLSHYIGYERTIKNLIAIIDLDKSVINDDSVKYVHTK